MNDEQPALNRIDRLEMRLAHQEQVIEDLNKMVTAQWRRIDGLVRQIGNLNTRLKEVTDELLKERPEGY